MKAGGVKASTEFHAEASFPRSAVPAQNVDRESLLASRPRLQSGERSCAVEEGGRGGFGSQKPDNAYFFSFWCAVLLRLCGI